MICDVTCFTSNECKTVDTKRSAKHTSLPLALLPLQSHSPDIYSQASKHQILDPALGMDIQLVSQILFIFCEREMKLVKNSDVYLCFGGFHNLFTMRMKSSPAQAD